MPVATVSVNPFNPACLDTSCLSQVVGLSGNDAAVQFSSCVAQFGSPVVSTVTPTETIFATATTTVEYIDIIVSLTTATSTLEGTLSSYESLVQTATEYTTTNVVTISTTVTANPAPSSLKKMRKRRGCTRRSSSTLTQIETVTTTELSEPSTTEPETNTETETITSTASAAPVCSDEAEYSSACSCIGAVSGVTETVTATADISTSTIYETVSSAIPSISESVVNVVVTTVVVKPATVTTTTTVSTNLQTTTTATTVAQPTQQAKLVLANGPRQGRYLTIVNSYVQYDINNVGAAVGAQFGFAPSGQPWLASNPDVKLYSTQTSSVVGALYMETAAQAAGKGDVAVTCNVDENGVMSCGIPSREFTKVFSCGAYLYIAKASWAQSGCVAVDFRIACDPSRWEKVFLPVFSFLGVLPS
ncbi:hypothetical protein QBC41DRAFT_374988 [Cercophora samala]|uniref:Uncharacterized protein n=1 Tax=Cercophora samala TaxID=330535 RepID=A0AA40D9N3_9PEZI|nr:hypothetical protein QBC41DRAFT_374988 [Cercophora samala]